MEPDDRMYKLLEEIRNTLAEQLAEYRRVTQHSLALQERATGRQEQIGQIYRRVVLLGGVMVAVLLGLLLYLLVRWSPYLFR